MKVPETKARQERRERRIRRREELAAEEVRRNEERAREYAERRREWEAGPRIFRIWARGLDKPYEIQFLKTEIPWNPGPDGKFHPLDPETVRKAVQAEVEMEAREAKLQRMADKVLADQDFDEQHCKSEVN